MPLSLRLVAAPVPLFPGLVAAPVPLSPGPVAAPSLAGSGGGRRLPGQGAVPRLTGTAPRPTGTAPRIVAGCVRSPGAGVRFLETIYRNHQG